MSMNVNAQQVYDFLLKKSEDGASSSVKGAVVDASKSEIISGCVLSEAQYQNAIMGADGLLVYGFIFLKKETVCLRSASNKINQDRCSATAEQRKQWDNAEIDALNYVVKDEFGNPHTFTLVKVSGVDQAEIRLPTQTENGWEIDDHSPIVGVIRYQTDSRHPYLLDLDKDMPIVLSYTLLKPPSNKDKIMYKFKTPDDLQQIIDDENEYLRPRKSNFLNSVLQAGVSTAISVVSHSDGQKTVTLEVVSTPTVAAFKKREFSASQTVDGIGELKLIKASGDAFAMVFKDGEHIGKAWWKSFKPGMYRGRFDPCVALGEERRSISEHVSIILKEASVKKIQPLNPVQPEAPANTMAAALDAAGVTGETTDDQAGKKAE